MSFQLTQAMKENMDYVRTRYAALHCREDVEEAVRTLTTIGNFRSAESAPYRSAIESALDYYKCSDSPLLRLLEEGKMAADDIVAVIPPEIKRREDVLNGFVMDLAGMYDDMYQPEDYMRRLVNRLPATILRPGEEGSVRVSILTQLFNTGADGVETIRKLAIRTFAEDFEKETGGKKRVSPEERHSFTAAHLNEELIEAAFIEAGGDYKKLPSLINTADSLSSGRFKTNGGTRKDLYDFAIAFGMTAAVGVSGDKAIKETDISINLFEDYYNNFILLDLADRFGKVGVESMPTGAGINYKNFIEVASLYVIRRSDLSAAEKFSLLNRIREAAKAADGEAVGQAEEIRPAGAQLSEFCHDHVVQIFSELEKETCADEKQLAREVAAKLGRFLNTDKLEIKTDSEQNRAFEKYLSLVADLKAEVPGNLSEIQLPRETDSCWDRFTSAKEIDEKEDCYCTAIDRFAQIMSDKDLFSISSPERVTRVSLMAVYFYLFCQINKNAMLPLEQMMEFMVGDLDRVLEEAGYQLVSEKNFFDMILVFSAYIRLELDK